MHWRDIWPHIQLWWFRITFPFGGILGAWGLAKMYEWIMERTTDQRVRPCAEPKKTLGAGKHRCVSQITDKLTHARI